MLTVSLIITHRSYRSWRAQYCATKFIDEYTYLDLKSKYQFIGCNEVPRFKDYGKLSNSFFGATKHNPILKRLLTTNAKHNKAMNWFGIHG